MTTLAKGDRVYDPDYEEHFYVVALGREASDGWLDDSHVLLNPHEPEADDCCRWARVEDLEPALDQEEARSVFGEDVR